MNVMERDTFGYHTRTETKRKGWQAFPCLMILILCCAFSFHAFSAIQKVSENALGIPISLFEGFSDLYRNELGSIRGCEGNVAALEHKVCSEHLRNEGNAPYILYVRGSSEPAPIVVLFHGLTDSPFYLRGIAEHLQSRGYTVVVPLIPGHGKKFADADMEDPNLKQRWYEHVDDVMALVNPYSTQRFIGGFSTGGTLATRYTLLHSEEVDGLLLFSGALALSNSAENLARIWGMKSLAKLFDGDFETGGPYPYRYPDVAGYAGLTLADVIFEIRDMLDEGNYTKPIFVAHSMADIITPFRGVEDLTQRVNGNHQVFTIDKSYDTCHQDLVMSSFMMIDFKVDKRQLRLDERCAIPKPNPLFGSMTLMLDYYMKGLQKKERE
jgi:pimeloyl-ACP methyl ester carboxylesterase